MFKYHEALKDAVAQPLWHDPKIMPAPLPALTSDETCELLIVGGGFTGLWAAMQAKERNPDVDIILIEKTFIGDGASGRNGGFLSTSLAHGETNVEAQFPGEADQLDQLGEQNMKEFLGTLGGAALGGYLGSKVGSGTGQLAATAGGALLGALVGGNIGHSLDEVDKMKAAQAHTQAQSAPIGETIAWNNPDTGHSGTVTAKRDGYDTNGDYCREFQQTITVGGKTEQAYGTACRQPDGSWRIIN